MATQQNTTEELKQMQGITLTDPEKIIELLRLAADETKIKIRVLVEYAIIPRELSTQETIDMIGCKRGHLHNLIAKGIIKRVRTASGRLRFNRDEIQQLINEGRV